jgi:hypothetical protein
MCMKFASAAAAAMLASVVSFNAQALPVSPSQSGQGAPIVTLVAQGCGPGFHRNAFGACRPNGYVVVPGAAVVAEPAPVVVAPAPVVVAPAAPIVVAPVVCPVGYHLGPRGRACRPNI